MGSRLKSSTQRALDLYLRMEAIKKKMQAMKVEKDNACDRCDACEEASKVAKLRAEKAEEEVLELMNKARQLETELDVTARAEFAEKSVQKLQKEVDRLEDELVGEQEKFKAITEELEQTFAEMSGY